MFSLILSVLIYGTPPVVVAGLLICWRRTLPLPTIATDQQNVLAIESLCLKDELSALESLKAKQENLRRQKVQIYSQGDRAGLNRRQSDGRFDARGQGRSLNAKLARLDQHFAAIENETLSIHMNTRSRYQEKLDEYVKWRPKRSLFVAFRNALIVYVVSLVALLGYNLYSPIFSSLFPPLLVAAVLAIAVVLFRRRPGDFFAEFDGDPSQDSEENISNWV
jgi:hypothetical protein